MFYFILALFIVTALLLKSSKVKGIIGEMSVSFQLKMLDKEKYFVLNDIVVPTTNGKTTQIDHVVVSPYGIFVIETKNYRGWIMGDENSQYWTQVIYKRKERLYNPIHQNYGHIKALEAVLNNFSGLPFISFVSFSMRADLKVRTSSASNVIYNVHIRKTIAKYTESLLSEEDTSRIISAIQSASLKDKYAKRDHVKALKDKLEENAVRIEKGECPKCGSQLVERSGKYGKFKGCGNYPKCRFIVKN